MTPRANRRETTPRRDPVRVPQTVPEKPNPERRPIPRPATPARPQPARPGPKSGLVR